MNSLNASNMLTFNFKLFAKKKHACEINMLYVPSNWQFVDIFTKDLRVTKFQNLNSFHVNFYYFTKIITY